MVKPSFLPRRRALLGVTAAFLISGCRPILPSLEKPLPQDPRQTLDAYFSLLARGQYDTAAQFLSPSYRARLGPDGTQLLLHSIQAARVDQAVDAVEWATHLGAHLPAPPANQREYLVTVWIQPSPMGLRLWSPGTNRRFVDLVRTGPRWQIDAIETRPGALITGQPPSAVTPAASIIPISPLMLGDVPVDQAIYTARQHAADAGGIPWALDPIAVVQRDGASFGLRPDAPVRLIQISSRPHARSTAIIEVDQDHQTFRVTLVQPVRSGPGGVWAIAHIERVSSSASPASPVPADAQPPAPPRSS
ncbi:MAG TPA: hypothetical protein VKY56_01170 [Chloroflexota bacterium]|nr:hypothetical protein [Chloroflexota bacterium]